MATLTVIFDPNDKLEAPTPELMKRLGIMRASLSVRPDVAGAADTAAELSLLLLEQAGFKADYDMADSVLHELIDRGVIRQTT